MKYYLWAAIWCACLHQQLEGQTPCMNPVVLTDIQITPACGGPNGRIAVALPEPASAFTWTWNPAVSNGPQAFPLAAGNYALRIERIGAPACFLDTILAVPAFPNALQVQIVDVQASNCLASNGSVQLAPAAYLYQWSNTESGAFNDGLASGIYTVTATEPGTGCQTVLEVSVPNAVNFTASATVVSPSKCNRPTGRVSIVVEGGFGPFSYSLGGSEVSSLPSGPGFCVVVDNFDGCADTAFFDIPVVTAFGEVEVLVQPPLCAGYPGNASVNVTPGLNFQTPYTFSITTAAGTPVSGPVALWAGDYLLYVADADSCVLPPAPFTVSEPAPVHVTAALVAGDCQQGGGIGLTISGGVGPYITDWLDVGGNINTAERAQLNEGRYQVVVYDSLFCRDSLDNLLVTRDCARKDTFHLLAPVGGVRSFCFPVPTGFSPSELGYSLLGPTASAFGTWSLSGPCVEYSAFQAPGYLVDIIAVQVLNPVFQRTDTVWVRVSILPAAPERETISFTVQVEKTAVACGAPLGWAQPFMLPLNLPALSGNARFGRYTFATPDPCIQYTAFDQSQFFADSMAVAVCDAAVLRCKIFAFVASVLPFSDCSGGILEIDSLSVPTVDCIAGGRSCISIPYANILNFNIVDNNAPYAQGALGCDEKTVTSYAVADLPGVGSPGNGPYHLDEWLINGVNYAGVFSDVAGLLAWMNEKDPSPGWYLENFVNLIGGSGSNMYGPLRVTAANLSSGVAMPTQKLAPLGTELRFSTGEHLLILKKIQTGCSDSLRVNVECFDCPPVHNYPIDAFGNVVFLAPACASDTVLVSTIPSAEAGNWTFYDNNLPLTPILSGALAAFRLDTGYHLLRIRNTITTCEYFVSFFYDCRNAPSDFIRVQVSVGETKRVCLDTNLLEFPIITIANICGALDVQTSTNLEENTWCAAVQGLTPGVDTLCLQLCDETGVCVVTQVIVTVTDGERVLVYNALSPNGDQKNDVWTVEGIEAFPNNRVWVYNRWGHEVFQKNAYANDWGGEWNGHPLPAGTYYYAIDLGDGSPILKGSLTIW